MPRKTTTNPLHWLPFPVDRWLGELAGGLRPEQKGALMDLLLTAWQQQPPCTLPDDPVYLAARSGLGATWKRLSLPIMRHWDKTDDGRVICPWLRHIYDDQLTKYQNRSNANRGNRSKRGPGNDEGGDSWDDSGNESGDEGGTNGTGSGTNGTEDGGQSIEPRQSLKTDSTTTSAIEPEEFERRLALLRSHTKAVAVAAMLPTDDDREAFYMFLVRCSAMGSDRTDFWLASFRDWLNPEGMDGVKATPAILAQAIREYGMNGHLDEGCQPTARFFKAFVIYVRDGLERPVRPGSKNWKQKPRAGAGVASKPTTDYDTTGNQTAADRMRRDAGET